METYNKEWLHRIGETQKMDYSEVVEIEEEIKNIPSSIIFRDGQKFINRLKQSKGGVIYYTPDTDDDKFNEFKKDFETEFENWKIAINNLSDALKTKSIDASKDLLQQFKVNENKDNIIKLYEHYYKLIEKLEKPKLEKPKREFPDYIKHPNKDFILTTLHRWLDGQKGHKVAKVVFALEYTESIDKVENMEGFIRDLKDEFEIQGTNRAITKFFEETDKIKIEGAKPYIELIKKYS